jgi:hypothetical protein
MINNYIIYDMWNIAESGVKHQKSNQINQKKKDKRTNNDLQNIHIKDRIARIPLKPKVNWKMNESVYYYYILLFLYFVYQNVKPM